MNEEPMNDNDEMRDNYDFTGGVRGKYYERYQSGTSVILLDADVAEMFKDSKEVNDILRALIPTLKKRAS